MRPAVPDLGTQVQPELQSGTPPRSVLTLTFGGYLSLVTFGHGFSSSSVPGVTQPSTLQTSGYRRYRCLHNVTLPSRALPRVTLPSLLQSLTFGFRFNQSWCGVCHAAEYPVVIYLCLQVQLDLAQCHAAAVSRCQASCSP